MYITPIKYNPLPYPLSHSSSLLLNAHCHLFNCPSLDKLLEDDNRIYISNALDENELNHHLLIKKSNFFISTGQHPLYPKDTIKDSLLIKLLDDNKIYAVGEIGFDKRNKNLQSQISTFLNQVDIANQYEKPVIIHCVGHYYELFNLLKKNFKKVLIILHAFNSSIEVINMLNEFNIVFSIHNKILKMKKARYILHEIISNHRFVFETDTGIKNEHDITLTISNIADFMGVEPEKLLNGGRTQT